LPHIFERIIMCQIYIQGASIAFHRGDPLLFIEDVQACRPTILPAAPRVLNKIYDRIQVGIADAGGWKKKLFDAAVRAKTKNLLSTGQLSHGFYDRLVFDKIKRGLGLDCIRVVVSGSAPLSKHVMNFYRILLGVPVLEGYGQTENAACASISLPEDMSTAGHVGAPNPAVEMVLADVPEMGYLHTDVDHRGQPCQGEEGRLVDVSVCVCFCMPVFYAHSLTLCGTPICRGANAWMKVGVRFGCVVPRSSWDTTRSQERRGRCWTTRDGSTAVTSACGRRRGICKSSTGRRTYSS
jgi:acyl-CoA synthetase (AMP-forming)/AMP-acid ligase II